MSSVSEIAPDVYRICVYAPEINLQFNHFLVKDDEPLLFHTGLRRMFPDVREAVATVMDPAKLRWISWSHFESDECGALNDWLSLAPHAEPACNMVGALVNVNDFACRSARASWVQTTYSPRASTASGIAARRNYRTAGMLGSCWRRRTVPCSAPTCSTKTE